MYVNWINTGLVSSNKGQTGQECTSSKIGQRNIKAGFKCMRLKAGSIINEKNKLNIAEYDIDPLTYFDLRPLVPLGC